MANLKGGGEIEVGKWYSLGGRNLEKSKKKLKHCTYHFAIENARIGNNKWKVWEL